MEKTTVCFVSLEDPGEVVRFRLRAIVEHYGLSYELIAQNLKIIEIAEGDTTLMLEHTHAGMRELIETPLMSNLRDAVAGAGAIFLDNASDAYGGDENQRRQVRKFIRSLVDLARENNDAGIVLLAHLDKLGVRNGTGGNSYSGSTAWHNSVRSRLALLPSSDEGYVELVQEKSNYGRKAEPVYLKWADDGPVLMPVERNRSEELREATEADATVLHKMIHDAVAAGKQIPAAMSGPNTVFHELEVLPGYPDRFHGRPADDRKRIKSAVDLLLRDRRLVRVEAATEYRGKRWYLEPQGDPSMGTPF